MKSAIQLWLQKIFGYERYLYFFGIFSVWRYRLNWKKEEFGFFIDMISKVEGKLLLDIGGNIGVTATILAKAFPEKKIYSFEPVIASFKTSVDILSLFSVKNAFPHKAAVGDESGKVEIITPIIDGVVKQGLSYIKHKVDCKAHLNKGAFISEDIVMVRLDDFVPSLTSTEKVAGIKIDVENSELFVFKGGATVLAEHRPIIFAEMWENERKMECFNLMESYGYAVKVFFAGKLAAPSVVRALNYFFIPNELVDKFI